MVKRFETVKKNVDFNNMINNGKVLKSDFYNIYYADNNISFAKFGIAVSKKYGNAVERNKIKRQIRNIIDNNKNLFSKNKNYIIMVGKKIKLISYSQMEEDLVKLLQKGKLNEKS